MQKIKLWFDKNLKISNTWMWIINLCDWILNMIWLFIYLIIYFINFWFIVEIIKSNLDYEQAITIFIENYFEWLIPLIIWLLVIELIRKIIENIENKHHELHILPNCWLCSERINKTDNYCNNCWKFKNINK